MRNSLTFFITCCNLLLLYFGCVTARKCVKIANCQCRLEGSESGINLTGTNTTSTLTFGVDGHAVTFNPCRPVNLTSITTETFRNKSIPVQDTCNDTSLICLTVVEIRRISIGSYDSLTFETDAEDNVYLKSYSNGWETTIQLVCKNTTNSFAPDTLQLVKFDSTTTPKTIELELSSNSSCPVIIPLNSSESSGWSTFFEVIFVVIFVYFVGGILFKKIFFDAEGMEMLPNHLFWISVLENIAEFFKYVSGGCRSGSAYNEI